MTGSVLSTALAGMFFAAFLTGWVLHWVWCMVSRAASDGRGRMRALVGQLHDAEEAREAAEARLAAVEAQAAANTEAWQQAWAAAETDYQLAVEALQAEAAREVGEARREAETAWEGLAQARQRIGELEREVDEARR